MRRSSQRTLPGFPRLAIPARRLFGSIGCTIVQNFGSLVGLALVPMLLVGSYPDGVSDSPWNFRDGPPQASGVPDRETAPSGGGGNGR